MQISLVISDAAIRTASLSPVLLALHARLSGVSRTVLTTPLYLYSIALYFYGCKEINICQCVNN